MPRTQRKPNLVHLFTGDSREHKAVRDTLWRHLSDERRKMRQVCRDLNHVATCHAGQLFRTLYVEGPLPDKDLDAVRVVGPLCHSLTITVNGQRNKSTGSEGCSDLSDRHNGERKGLNRCLWIRLLSSFHQLRILTVRAPKGGAASAFSEIGQTLITLRIAVERNRLPELKTLCLSPLYSANLVHLCWLGFPAFRTTSAPQRNWEQLRTLDLRLHIPSAAGSPANEHDLMLRKVFYSYLRSFSKSLTTLRVVWLGSEGPGPLTLHLEAGLEDRKPIQWRSLEELRIGNIYLPLQMMKLAKQLAPSLRSMHMLRSTHSESGFASASDSSAWLEIDLSGHTPGWKGRHSRASSVYSQRSDTSSVYSVEDVSRSSRSILVYKDF